MEPRDPRRDDDADQSPWGGPDDRTAALRAVEQPPTVTRPVTVPAPKRARVGLLVLVAFVLELVAIAAGANQFVTKQITDHRINNSTGDYAVHSWLTFAWRFSPKGSDADHVWLAQLAAVVATLLLTALLVGVAVRGVVTFWRAFLGVWAAVLAATVLGRIAFGAIVTPHRAGLVDSMNGALAPQAYRTPLTGKRLDRALFQSVFGDAVFAGLALGLVLGVIIAVLAVATRRAELETVPAETPDVTDHGPQPEAPAPYYGDPSAQTSVFDRPAAAPSGGYIFDQPSPQDRPWRAPDAAPADAAPADAGPRDVEPLVGSQDDTRQFPPVGAPAPAPAAAVDPEPTPAHDTAPAHEPTTAATPAHDTAPAHEPATAATPLDPTPAEPTPAEHDLATVDTVEPHTAEPHIAEPHIAEPQPADVPTGEPDDATEQPPAPAHVGDDPGVTTQFPRIEDEPPAQHAEPQHGEPVTEQFPRPPHDEHDSLGEDEDLPPRRD